MYKFIAVGSTVEELHDKILDEADLINLRRSSSDSTGLVDTTKSKEIDHELIQEQIKSPENYDKTREELGMSTDVDSRGIPWDSRIHALNKAKSKDGSWKKQRGCDDALFFKIEAELKTKAVNQAVHEVPPVPAAPIETPSFAEPFKAPVAPPVQTTMIQPQYDNIPIPETTRPAHTFATFRNDLVPTLARLVNEGKITQAYLGQLKEHFKVKEIWEMTQDTDSCMKLFDGLCSHGLITRMD